MEAAWGKEFVGETSSITVFIKKLREMVGTMSLDDLYFEAYVVTMDSLVIRKRFIHPAAFDIWNGLVQQHTRKDKSRQGDPNVIL